MREIALRGLRSARMSGRGVALAGILAIGGVLAYAGVSVATAVTLNPAVSAAFSNAKSSLGLYLGLGVAIVLALFLVGLGVRLLIKWARRGVQST